MKLMCFIDCFEILTDFPSFGYKYLNAFVSVNYSEIKVFIYLLLQFTFIYLKEEILTKRILF